MNRQRFLILFAVLALIAIVLVNCTPVRQGEANGQIGDARPTKESTAVPTSIHGDTAELLTAVLDTPHDLNAFPPQANLTVNFNRPMNPDGSGGSLFISPATVGGLATWNEAKTSLTFVPDTPFSLGETYTIHLNPLLTSAIGDTFEAAPQWQIQVLTAPTVTSITPTNPVLDSRRPTWAISFDRPMDFASLQVALAVEPEVDLTLTWHENTLYIQPTEALEPGELYHFTLAETAVDQHSLPLGTSFTWNGRLPDLVLQKHYPTDRRSLVAIEFNYPIDPTSITLQWLPEIAGTVAWNENDTLLTFTPDTPFMLGESYTLRFTGTLRDANGETLPLPASLHFSIPDVISSVQPTNNQWVSAINHIEVRFNQAMNQGKTAESLTLTPTIAGEINWEGNRMIFTPENGRFAPETTYTVSLDAAKAVDAEGDAILTQPFIWSFSTDQTVHVVSFGSGEHTQVMNANGRRAVQYSFSYQQEPVPVTFNLYRLTLEQWQTSGIGELVNQWTGEPLPRTNDYLHTQETTLPANLSVGIYRLDLLENGYLEDSLTIFLTYNGLTLKQDGETLLVWVAGFDGTFVPAAEVLVYQGEQLVGNGRTDHNGLFQLDIPYSESLQVVARVGEDATTAPTSWSWRTEGSLHGESSYLVHLYTDRPIYHPDQPVYFRAIIRQQTNASLAVLPAETSVTVKMVNPQGNVLETQSLFSSHFGTVHGEFMLPGTPLTGTYYLEAIVNGVNSSRHFDVAVDPDPNYQVTVTTDAPIYAQGDTIQVTVEGRDSNGQPIANARVTVRLYESGYSNTCFSSPSFDGDWYDSYRDAHNGTTDANGRFTLTLPAELNYSTHNGLPGSNTQHSVWAIAATLTFNGGEKAGGFAVVETSNVGAQTAVDIGSALKNVEQEFVVQADVMNAMGQPMKGQTVYVTLMGYNTETGSFSASLHGTAMTTNENGRATTPFTIGQPGHYQIRVTGYDASGNEFYTNTDVYAYSPNDTSFNGPDGFTITADRARYAPGDTAHLIIRSTSGGATLLTFSRSGIYQQQVVNLTPPLTIVEAPITAEDAPNLYVTAHVWDDLAETFTGPGNIYNSLRDNTLLLATVNLHVVDPASVSQVTIIPGVEAPKAGQTIPVTVRVTNGLGEPISAELSLSLVDNALFDHYSAHTGTLESSFYYNRYNSAVTYHSMVPTRYLESGDWGGCGCGGGWGELGELTADFTDITLWFPALVTDANGEAALEMTLPDTAGEWRLTARAVTADTQVGETFIIVETK